MTEPMAGDHVDQTSERIPPALEEQLGRSGAGRRRRERSRWRRFAGGCLPVLLVLVVVGLLLYVGVTRGLDWLDDQFADPADYPGPGHGRVLFEVHEGDSTAEIGRNLKDADVVASVEAFLDEAGSDPQARSIQVGFYQLKKEMSAADALAVLVDPDNLVSNVVTVPEGLTADATVGILADKTDFGKAAFERVLDRPEQLGLPDYANGNPEGYLFPATYGFAPNAKPLDMLRAMVDRWRQAAEDADLETRAKELGYTPHEVMTVASLVEAESRRDADRGKVARVIYNRLENPGTAGTTGRLEIDATINYALGRDLGFAISDEDKAFDSPYNTYVVEGLPPGPIEAPGDAAIRAAVDPTPGDWYYYVTVNLRTGETKFAETYQEFLRYREEFRRYCSTSDAC